MKVYIACGLTAIPREVFGEYSTFIHRLAAALKECGCESVRYALVDSDPHLAKNPECERARLCYLWDRELVEQADVVIADVTFPSLGVGIELQVAQTKDIPVILCFRKSAESRLSPVSYENPDHTCHSLQIGEGYVSLMALGLPTISQIIEYVDCSEGIREIVQAFTSVRLA